MWVASLIGAGAKMGYDGGVNEWIVREWGLWLRSHEKSEANGRRRIDGYVENFGS
jgi:hypothetical protein